MEEPPRLPPSVPPVYGGVSSTVPPAVPGWYFCSADRQVFGPYSLQQLIESAKEGRILNTDNLLHSVLTQNVWVTVSRIPEVFCHIAPPPPPTPLPVPIATTVYPRVRRSHNRPSNGIRIFRDVVAPVMSIAVIGLIYWRFNENQGQWRNAQVEDRVTLVPKIDESRSQSPSRDRPPALATQRDPQPPADRYSPPITSRNEFFRVETESNASKIDEPKAELPVVLATKAEMQQAVLTVELEIAPGKQLVELPEIQPNRRIAITKFSGKAPSLKIEPEDGIITTARPVFVQPYGDRAVYLSLLGMAENGMITKIRIEFLTGLDWLGGSDLSADRLRRKRIAMLKQGLSVDKFDAFCKQLSDTFENATIEFFEVD